MKIAQTILEQLGGTRFIAMTGAKNFVNIGDALQFSIGRGTKNGANKVVVKLNSSDLYDVDFWKCRGAEMQLLNSECNVSADQLQAVFTEQTGLYTRL